MKDTIGLIHPASCWHSDSAELRGMEIEVVNITDSLYINGVRVKGWYNASVRIVNPPASWKCVADRLHLNGFRPRRVA